MKKLRKYSHERGFGMLEVGLALVVVAFAAAGLSKMLTSNVAATKAKSNAERLAMVTLAADQYLIQNEQQLKTVLPAGGAPIAIPVGKTCATCAVPSGPSGLPSVQGDGLLSSAYVDLNNNQQSHALIVKELSSGDLDAIVTTYGGSAIDDENLGYITGLIGAAAGGVYSNGAIAPTNQISGAHGGWGDATSNWNASIGGTNVRPSSGHVQVSLSLAQASGMGAIDPDDVLFRTSNGNATRNTMATDLLLGANDIWGGSTIEGRSFRDRDNGWLVNPDGSSQFQGMLIRGSTNMGPAGNETIMFRPNNPSANTHILVGNTPGNQSYITGDGEIYADNYFQVGETSGNRVLMWGNGNFRAENYVQVGETSASGVRAWDNGDLRATRDVIADDDVNAADRVNAGTHVNAGQNVNAGVNVNAGQDVNASDDVNAVDDIYAGDNITSGGSIRAEYDIYARVFKDITPGQEAYEVNPGGGTIVKNLRVSNQEDAGTRDVFINGTGDVRAGGDMFALAYYDASSGSGDYVVNPGWLSRMNRIRVGDPNDTANDIILRANGTIHMDNDITASAYYYTSDERLKEDIQDLEGWPVLAGLEPKSYRYKKDGRLSMGLIAQDVEKVLPHLVQEDEDGMKSVNYVDLIGPMLDEIQSLHAEMETLKQAHPDLAFPE